MACTMQLRQTVENVLVFRNINSTWKFSGIWKKILAPNEKVGFFRNKNEFVVTLGFLYL